MSPSCLLLHAAQRPDNAPICLYPIAPSSGTAGKSPQQGVALVTLRGGGLFAVDYSTTPITIIAEYDNTTVGGNGCGGLQARNADHV